MCFIFSTWKITFFAYDDEGLMQIFWYHSQLGCWRGQPYGLLPGYEHILWEKRYKAREYTNVWNQLKELQNQHRFWKGFAIGGSWAEKPLKWGSGALWMAWVVRRLKSLETKVTALFPCPGLIVVRQAFTLGPSSYPLWHCFLCF